MTNQEAIKVLDECNFYDSDEIVGVLVAKGFIEADPIPVITEPQQMVLDAKAWLGKYGSSADAFQKASGWSTESWQIVIKEQRQDDRHRFNEPSDTKNIFRALCILAQEAGIEFTDEMK